MKTNYNVDTRVMITIAGTYFFLDVSQEEFIEVNNTSNRISFNEIHEIEDNIYGFLYDKEKKDIDRNPWGLINDSETIAIPIELAFSPEKFFSHALKDKNYIDEEMKKASKELESRIKELEKKEKKEMKKSRRKSRGL